MKNLTLTVISILMFGGMPAVFAGDTDVSKQITTDQQLVPVFRHGAQEVELLGGPMFAISGHTAVRPKIDYAIEAIRWGYMVNDVHGSGFFRGNAEISLEGFGGEVFNGPGHALGGGMLILRHNFVQEGWKLVPYIQIGGGGLANDIWQNQVQRRVGEDFEFMLHGGLGARYLINDHMAVSLEASYRHISNADLASRNGGLDSLGATLGFNILY
jgi:hypothetical protein